MNAWILFGVTLVATLLLSTMARRLGFGDAASGPASGRKLQRSPVPPVGGLAIVIAYSLVTGFQPERGWREVLLLVLLVGTLDDVLVGGLKPVAKLGLQSLAVAVPLSLAAGGASFFATGPYWLGLALVAMNVTNTFDNADGAVASVAAVGFLFTEPALAAIPLGFLFFNLDAGAPWRRAADVPSAYLGDGGAYVLGLLVLLHGHAFLPGWGLVVLVPALWIPLLDLLRLSVVRWRAGSRPWVGDRRHLAHRLQARGLSPFAVAAVLAGLTVPGCLGVFLAERHPLLPALGLGLGGLIYVFAVRRTPASQ